APAPGAAHPARRRRTGRAARGRAGVRRAARRRCRCRHPGARPGPRALPGDLAAGRGHPLAVPGPVRPGHPGDVHGAAGRAGPGAEPVRPRRRLGVRDRGPGDGRRPRAVAAAGQLRAVRRDLAVPAAVRGGLLGARAVPLVRLGGRRRPGPPVRVRALPHADPPRPRHRRDRRGPAAQRLRPLLVRPHADHRRADHPGRLPRPL
ncbi:MAG: hypothetical protein AVDCRST_MAG41-3287, partial [uncultured Corynebacteriales bacterium]